MTTETIPAPTPALHNDVRWNLSDLYSGMDDPRIDQALDDALARAQKFQADYKGKLSSPDLTAETLAAALREYEALHQDAGKPAYYASLLFTTDTSDPARGAFLQKVRERGTQLAIPLLFMDLELAALPEATFAPLAQSAAVAPYAHYLHTLRLYRDHLLSEPEERLLEETANTGGRAFRRLFSETVSNAAFTFRGETMNQAKILSYLYDADPETRREAALAITEGLKANYRTITFLFNTLLQDKNVSDRLRHYEYPEQSRHMTNELPRETVDLVVDTVARNYPLVARFYHVKREILGLDTLAHYDRYAPLFEAEGVVTFPDARQIVLDAFGDFSPTLRDLAAEFFDKGWIDAPPAPGKEGGAYCQYVTPDLHPFVFMNYLGRMRDVMTLAHELGHGVHASLSRKQSLLNFHGTLPLAELASTFGEMLVFERVSASASPKDQLALYAQKIEDAFATIPRQTALYRFEQAIHKHRRSQGELTPDDFGSYWQKETQAMFGASVQLGDEHRLWWSYIGHFVNSPFYVYAYSFGELLALSLYRQAQSGGPVFAQKYLDMLAAGGSLSPQELMAKVGIDLDDPAFWQGGFEVLEGLVSRFEQLWQEYRQAQ